MCGIVHSLGFSIHSAPITAHVISVVPQITSTSPWFVGAGDDLLTQGVDGPATEQRAVGAADAPGRLDAGHDLRQLFGLDAGFGR